MLKDYNIRFQDVNKYIDISSQREEIFVGRASCRQISNPLPHPLFLVDSRYCSWTHIFFLGRCISQSTWWNKDFENTIYSVSIQHRVTCSLQVNRGSQHTSFRPVNIWRLSSRAAVEEQLAWAGADHARVVAGGSGCPEGDVVIAVPADHQHLLSRGGACWFHEGCCLSLER